MPDIVSRSWPFIDATTTSSTGPTHRSTDGGGGDPPDPPTEAWSSNHSHSTHLHFRGKFFEWIGAQHLTEAQVFAFRSPAVRRAVIRNLPLQKMRYPLTHSTYYRKSHPAAVICHVKLVHGNDFREGGDGRFNALQLIGTQ